MSRSFDSGSNRRNRSSRLTRWLAPPPDPLPPPLRELGDRLAEAFSLDNLKDLAFTVGIEPESVPGDTLPKYAMGLARAAWCRGCLESLLAEAVRERPTRADDWAMPALPDPPAERCEEGPLLRPSVFGDSRQVATFVLLLLLAAAAVAAGMWWARQPRPMTADFNIAVAAVDVAALDTDAEAIGQMLQQQVVAIVEGQLPNDTTATTAVSGERMPVVGDATAAARLAEQVNAQLVIYGSAEAAGDTIRYTPSFYILLDTVQADVGEMQGGASLEAPLSFTLPELLAESPPTGRTAAAATLLTSFVRALVNLAGDDIPAARHHIDTAVAQTERYVADYEPFAGREVVYLFASQIARIQAYESPDREAHLAAAQGHVERALKINPAYGRAVIALANIQFDRGEMASARQLYYAAAALPKQPPEALVALKAGMGIGNVNLRQLGGMDAGTACAGEVGQWADEAERYYSAVIAVQAAEESDDARLRQMAARALTYRGEVHRFCGRADAAVADYRAALKLEPGPPLDEELRRLLVALTGEEE